MPMGCALWILPGQGYASGWHPTTTHLPKPHLAPQGLLGAGAGGSPQLCCHHAAAARAAGAAGRWRSGGVRCRDLLGHVKLRRHTRRRRKKALHVCCIAGAPLAQSAVACEWQHGTEQRTAPLPYSLFAEAGIVLRSCPMGAGGRAGTTAVAAAATAAALRRRCSLRPRSHPGQLSSSRARQEPAGASRRPMHHASFVLSQAAQRAGQPPAPIPPQPPPLASQQRGSTAAAPQGAGP